MKRRFRASIYLDVFIEGDQDLEAARAKAKEQLEKIVGVLSQPLLEGELILSNTNYSNPYVGDCALYTSQNLLKPLDREI